MVTRLLSTLEAFPLPHLTSNEQSHLLTLIQTTLEVNSHSPSLDHTLFYHLTIPSDRRAASRP